jgi:hypothetical protein
MIFQIKSQRNRDQIVYQNYIFEVIRRGTTTIYWRCISKQFKATAISSVDYITIIITFTFKMLHNHSPDTNLVIRRTYIEIMKIR